MADPFATALGTLLRGPRAVAAVYTPNGGAAVPLRTIRSAVDAGGPIGMGASAIADGNTFVLALADVPARPKRGDQLAIGAQTLRIAGDGKLDAEGVSWIVEAS